MQISDSIYGNFYIDGVLEELILSKPVQRLKGVYQGGASFLVNEKWDVTRYEHSIGVMLLIKQLGGSLEEQIAGLLHDVSHTAFSHVIDFVYENHEEDFHEQIYAQIITNSEIPQILRKYGFDYQHILLDDPTWNLLERATPELCADRIDYTLRDMYHYGNITRAEIDYFIENITVFEGRIYFQSLEAAKWFVKTYYKEVIDFFLHPLNMYGYNVLAKTLQIALQKNIIDESSLLSTDEEVIALLQASTDRDVTNLLRGLHRNVLVEENKIDYHFHRKNKLRLIDPSIYHNGQLTTASKLSPEIKQMNELAKSKAEEGIYIKIITI